MQIDNIEDINVGMWAFHSCHIDLYEIKTEKEIKEIKDLWIECDKYDDFRNPTVFSHEREALLYIQSGWGSQCELDAIDKMLEDKKQGDVEPEQHSESSVKRVVINPLPIDIRELTYRINLIQREWKGGTVMEGAAIDYGIKAFHRFLCETNLECGIEQC